MSGQPTARPSLMVHLTIDVDGRVELQKGKRMTVGMAGLYLVEAAARLSMMHPSTQADRLAFKRALDLLATRPEPQT